MGTRIALAGNPNCGKTTLFNALTGANQHVGNWPGVTVEKKEGRLKGHTDVTVTDLPGIYSLSPYTLEEVVARKYLVGERPDVILNIVDGTNLERNLYLTTQVTELGIPVVVAVNMADLMSKDGIKLEMGALSEALGVPCVAISALKGTGIEDAITACIEAAKAQTPPLHHPFTGSVEHAFAHIEEASVHELPENQQRWYALKLFERDKEAIAELKLSKKTLDHIEKDIAAVEEEFDDDSESIISNERYVLISQIIKDCCLERPAAKMSKSDKIDRVVTNRWAALPIFAVVMFLVYFLSVSTVGTWATDWANDCLFGDGWHMAGVGSDQYDEAVADYYEGTVWTAQMHDDVDAAASAGVIGADELQAAMDEGDVDGFEEAYGMYADSLDEAGFGIGDAYEAALGEDAEGVPDPADYGIWVPGIPVVFASALAALNCAPWVESLVIDGIVGGVGAVLGFVPQMIVLFILLSFLEGCGYMSRVAFVLDRVFRRFGLSGKSFIPMLVGSGCGVPGIMASRTIESERDRRMTIMTTTFIPCSAKLPIIALISAALFGGTWWVAPSAYFLGIAAIVVSGIILKKTKMFSGNPAPFVMELPAYHLPTISSVLRSMWERVSSFIVKAGTIILLCSIVIWAGSRFGFIEGSFCFDADMELNDSLLGILGNAICWIFAPLGFGSPTAAVATIMGLVAKEEVVGVFGVLDFEGLTQLAGYSFLIFNLLCAPCIAAIGAIRREMGSAKWTWFAIGYQYGFAYTVALMVYQIGSALTGTVDPVWLVAAIALLACLIYLLFFKKGYDEDGRRITRKKEVLACNG